jgi:branched-chain amino acid transport system substrate-binding protein
MHERWIQLRRFVMLALVVALAAGPASVRAADPFEIMTILPTTGGGAFAGKEQARTLGALEEYVNRTGGIRGRPVHFAVYDTQSNVQLAVQFMNEAIARKVPVVVGPSFASECSATMALLKNGPVAYCLSPGVHPDPGSYMFSSSFSTVDLIAVMVRYMRDRGLKRIGLLTSTDTTGQDGERSVDAALADPANKDLSVVAREKFAPSDITVAAQVARLKVAAPQAVICWTTGTPFGTFLRNWHESGTELPILTTPGNQTYEQMAAYATILPKELLFASGPFAAPDQISDRAMRTSVQTLYDGLARVNARPGFPGQTPWDPGQLVIAALRKLGTDTTATQVRDYIASLRGWVGENGRYDFSAVPQRGLNGSSTVIVRWDPAKDTWVAASKLGGAPVR